MKKEKTLKNLYIFISGVIFASIVGALLKNAAIESEYIIIGIGTIAMLIAVFFFSEVYKQVLRIANWNSIKLKYLDEEFREEDGIPYKGIIHNELKELVNLAEFEILTVASATTNGVKSSTLDTSNRIAYLKQIEKQVQKKRNKGFKYIRIEHFPSSLSMKDLDEYANLEKYFGVANIEHTLNIQELSKKYHSEELDLSIMKATTQKNVNVMIVDQRYIALEGASAVNKSGKPYNEGLFIFDDKEGEMVKKYLNYFNRLMKHAVPLKIKPIRNNV